MPVTTPTSRPLRHRIFFIGLFAAASAAQTPGVLNLSHDLVANGIAKSNMSPNTPTLDSSPLFQAGVSYANTHHIATVTADRGSYYFLTQNPGNAYHVYLSVNYLTIDLQHSDLYFAHGNAPGMIFQQCSGVTLENFAMDYLNLPFTQVSVTAVNATAQAIAYQALPGWTAPATLNAYATPAGNDYFLFVLRDGQPLRQTGRLSAASPFTGSSLQVTGSNASGCVSTRWIWARPPTR